MALDPKLEQLRRVVASALEAFDRENSLAPDRHEPGCDCAACCIVACSRQLVDTLDEVAAGGDVEGAKGS